MSRRSIRSMIPALARISMLLALSAPPVLAVGQPSANVADVAARIEYGFLTADARTIRTAQEALGRAPNSDPWRHYFEALGFYRLALLSVAQGERRGVSRLINGCVRSSRQALEANRDFGESMILNAACLALEFPSEASRVKIRNRKVAGLLEKAEALDPRSPRLPLVSALAKAATPFEQGDSREIELLLEAARTAFDQQGMGFSEPDWGEPETLTLLGELHLKRGDLRAARDVVEQALMIAPEYEIAQELEARIGAAR